jgi:hypothetical protein
MQEKRKKLMSRKEKASGKKPAKRRKVSKTIHNKLAQCSHFLLR